RGLANDTATVNSTGKRSHSTRNQYRQLSHEVCEMDLRRNTGSRAAPHAIRLATSRSGPPFPVKWVAKLHNSRRLGRLIQLNGPAPVLTTKIATGKTPNPIQRQSFRAGSGILVPSTKRKERYCAKMSSAAKK